MKRSRSERIDTLAYSDITAQTIEAMKAKSGVIKVRLNNKQAMVFKHISMRLLEAELFDGKSSKLISKLIQVMRSAYYVFNALIFYTKTIEFLTVSMINSPIAGKSQALANSVIFEFTYSLQE